MVRRIQPGDAKFVRGICETALGHPTTTELLIRRIGELAEHPAYFIAVFEDENDHEVKGFIQAQTYDLLYGDDGWNIIALAVDRGARRQGIGSQLLQALEEHARSQGSSFVRLNSRADRLGAHAFYEHLGYHCDKTQKRFIRYLDE